MKKLFFGLATSCLLCFAVSSAEAQVRDTTGRQNNGNMDQQQTWPADSNKRDSVNKVAPAPNDPLPPPTPNTPSTRPGSDTFPRPQTDMPDVPRPNTSPNSPTTPTTGAPM